MPRLTIMLPGSEPVWPELEPAEIIHLANDAPAIQVAVLEGGMKSGLPSLALRLDLPDGKIVIAETSARLFCTAARAILARFPNLFEDGTHGQA